MTRRLLVVALVLGARTPASAQVPASRHSVELGVDALLAHDSDDGHDATGFTLPEPRLRVGFVLSDALSVESGLYMAYNRSSFTNPATRETLHGSNVSYELEIGPLFRFGVANARTRPYVRPFAGIRGFSDHIDDSEFDSSGHQVMLGGGLGVAIRVGDRVATRIEGGYRHAFENEPELGRSNRVSLSLGLSFFIG